MSAPLDTMFNGRWLMDQVFPPVTYVVPGVIPEGCTLLVAAPKIGKSWMVLGLGLAISKGERAFGVLPVGHPRPVLYLALEDGPRRLQDRLVALGATAVPETLNFMVAAPAGGIVPVIAEFLRQHAHESPLVILDTLGKVAPPATGGETAYEKDYRVGSDLKRLVDAVPGSSLVVVHHSRKMAADDFLDAVSGTQGLAGSADSVLLLKRDRLSKTATLSVTSRDAPEGEYQLRLEDAGTWILDGDTLNEAAQAARDHRVTAGVGDRMADVIATVGKFPEGIRPKDLKTLLPDVVNVDQYLKRAHEAGRIERLDRGLYAPVRSVSLDESSDPSTHTSNGSNTPNHEGFGTAFGSFDLMEVPS